MKEKTQDILVTMIGLLVLLMTGGILGMSIYGLSQGQNALLQAQSAKDYAVERTKEVDDRVRGNENQMSGLAVEVRHMNEKLGETVNKLTETVDELRLIKSGVAANTAELSQMKSELSQMKSSMKAVEAQVEDIGRNVRKYTEEGEAEGEGELTGPRP